jgi:HAD superfamily hydrolase (TIGR01509 family)
MKLLIFDVGGVLRDSSLMVYEGFRRAFAAEGLDFDFDAHDVWHLRGVGKYNRSFNAIIALIAITRSGDSVKEILKKPDTEAVLNDIVEMHISEGDSELKDRIRARYKEFAASDEAGDFVKIAYKCRESIDMLSRRFMLAVLTNASRPSFTRDFRDRIDLRRFSVIITADEMTKKKPDPECMLRIIKEVGVEPGEAAYVGDSVIDIMTARAAGCKSIVMTSGMASEEHLREEVPDYVFENVWEMTKEFMKGDM